MLLNLENVKPWWLVYSAQFLTRKMCLALSISAEFAIMNSYFTVRTTQGNSLLQRGGFITNVVLHRISLWWYDTDVTETYATRSYLIWIFTREFELLLRNIANYFPLKNIDPFQPSVLFHIETSHFTNCLATRRSKYLNNVL